MEQNEQTRPILLKLKDSSSERDFHQLYLLLYDRFFRIAVYYLKHEEWAQEVVLDIFMKLWNKQKELYLIKNFDNYCFILLKNASLNYLSKNSHHNTTSIDEQVQFRSINAPITPEHQLLNDELLLIYVDALENLPPKCREVFVLIREQGLSYKEVAEQMEISVKTVDAQLQKAVSRLKEYIKYYFSEN